MDTSINPITWTRLQAVVGRLAEDVQDTWTLPEHVRKLGLPDKATNDLMDDLATALGVADQGYDENPEDYLGSLHTFIGWTHDQIITALRTYLRDNDYRDADDGGTDGFVALHGYGRARRKQT